MDNTNLKNEMPDAQFKDAVRTFDFKYDWSEKQFFIYACFVDDLQQFYRDWIEQGRKIGRVQFFNVLANGKLVHKYWNPSRVCCETGEHLTPDNIDIKVGYWSPNLWKPIRKDLKQNAMKLEALECQKIDCSCNDCKNLDRPTSWCRHYCIKVSINANLCHPENIVCFEHRRS